MYFLSKGIFSTFEQQISPQFSPHFQRNERTTSKGMGDKSNSLKIKAK